MTQQRFLQEAILRLSIPNFINCDARKIINNWIYPYNHEVVVDVIAILNLMLIQKSPELFKFVRNLDTFPIDHAVLFFYETSYKKIIQKRFDL